MWIDRWGTSLALALGTAPFVLAGCGGGGGVSADLASLMQARQLNESDVTAALKTYTPTGRLDDYYLFASGGHGGNLVVIGVPSMRILKYVAVFTPEPWQGYAYGDQSGDVITGGYRHGRQLTWGDMHHPALSETGGDYDGKFLFVNDKANPRVAVIDLRDFVTTQIVTSELIESDHGATFVTPDTDYVVETSQYPAPLGGAYADLDQYDEKYRGAVIFWKFDRARGRIVPGESWAMELPPYMQDLADCGKRASDGWLFLNSFNTERARGGNMEGNVPLESGASQNDMDYLHLIPWRKAESVVKAGKTTEIAGMRVIPLDTVVAEGLLYFVGEPKSPHGCDVTPDGKSVVVSGKLDDHCTVYDVAKLTQLIDGKTFDGEDPYGIPILPFEKSIRGQVRVGLGPLHTQFDGDGNCYTSLFLEPAVGKWSLERLEMIDKIPVHYNVGHLVAAEGDTVSPDGKYLVAMNKWAIDRFRKVGPLVPQNFQLVDIAGEKMQLLYDMPIPLGEPHYAQMIKADKLEPIEMYSVGTDPFHHQVDAHAVAGGKERVERRPDGVHVYMTAVRSHFTPDIVRVKEGDTVHFHITNIEQAYDATHGFTIGSHNINLSLEPGKHSNVTVQATTPGVFPFYCTEFCSALHLEMAGYFLVEPR